MNPTIRIVEIKLDQNTKRSRRIITGICRSRNMLELKYQFRREEAQAQLDILRKVRELLPQRKLNPRDHSLVTYLLDLVQKSAEMILSVPDDPDKAIAIGRAAGFTVMDPCKGA